MKTEKLLESFTYVDDGYVAEAASLLDRMEDNKMGEQKPKNTLRKISKTFLIAAILASLLVVTAFAATLFSVSKREAKPDETYKIRWSDSENGFLEWKDLKYVFQFEGPEECREIRFKPGWLPFEPNEGTNAWAKEGDWYNRRLVSEGAPGVDRFGTNYQPYMVNVYYAPQFENGGAMLLMYQTPEEIIEEQWGDLQVMKFKANQHFDAIEPNEFFPEGSPERTQEFYFVIMFNPNEGYIIVVSGTSDMETVEHVAKELEIKQTDEIIKSSDFENNCTFIDVGQG